MAVQDVEIVKREQCYNGNIKLKKAGVTLPYTQEQVEEYLKCQQDIIYFIKTYVKIINLDRGLINFELYPFQEEMIKSFKSNRFSINLLPRQSGKCVTFQTLIRVRNKNTNLETEMKIGDFFGIVLTTNKCKIESDEKFTVILQNTDYDIKTPSGWKSVIKVFQTIPYKRWLIKTDTGRELECADTHILINSHNKQIFVDNLQLGDELLVENGIEQVVLIREFSESVKMYDIEIEDDEHLYYSNGFVSHNTTTVASYFLYESVFNNNIKLAILANKGDTAREILDRVKKMFEELPWFLKPGVVEWNKGSIELSNGNKIISAATSSSSIRGQTMNCVAGNTKVVFQDAIGAIYHTEIEKLEIAVDEIDYVHQIQDNLRAYFTIYELINTVTGETFFGYHETDDLSDGFLGAGQEIKNQIKEYGVQNLVKEYLGIFVSWNSCREFYHKISDILPIVSDNKHNITFNHKYTNYLNESDLRIQILSEGGLFRNFRGIYIKQVERVIIMTFNDLSDIIVTEDHEFLIDNEYIKANDIKLGDKFISQFGSKELLNKQSLFGGFTVYDPLEVEDVHNFFGNDTLSKQCVFLDELAFVSNDVDFFASTYPVITSGKNTKVIIASTPMGMNLFYKLWNDAINGRNDFVPKQFYWFDHPDRDDNWKNETIRNIGDKRFEQEFECVAGESIVTIRSANKIKEMSIEMLFNMMIQGNEYEVLTENGFKRFLGIKRKLSYTLNEITFDGGSIRATLEHQIKTMEGFTNISDLKCGDIISPNKQKIKNIEFLGICDYVYDLIEVEDGNHYLTNGITSHNCQFLGSANTLISSSKLQQLTHKEPIETDTYFNLYFQPDKDHNYVITVDTSEGIGKDYSVINVFDITEKPFQQVAIYRNNVIPPIMLSEIVFKMCQMYFEAYCIVETNGVGKIIADTLYNEFEYDNMLTSKIRDGENIVSGYNESVGLRQTRKTKLTGSSALKALIESDSLIVHDFTTVQELTTFIRRGSSYQAENGKYDDTTMTLVMFAWFTHQPYFESVTDESMRDIIKSNYLRMEDADNMIFGFFNDGTEEFEEGVFRF